MTFAVPAEDEHDPRPIMRRLVENEAPFELIRVGEADIMVLMRLQPKHRQGRHILGTMEIPGWQGSKNDLGLWLLEAFYGAMPDFIMILDAEWWETAGFIAREALVFHELLHCDQARDKEGELKFNDEGRPVWGIRGHDIEEFNEVVRRYGAWKSDIQEFLDAARGANAR